MEDYEGTTWVALDWRPGTCLVSDTWIWGVCDDISLSGMENQTKQKVHTYKSNLFSRLFENKEKAFLTIHHLPVPRCWNKDIVQFSLNFHEKNA
jgi:hypothetical protein